jgi:Omp85 superfamily domain/WD40-like Beta Propeller Repeat/Dipeptidyl peptidase IV (DPP IV) N-terminal region
MRVLKVLMSTIILGVLLSGTVVGQEVYFGKNKVQYRDFNWHYIQSPNFDIYFYEDQIDLATFAAEEMEKSYTKIAEELKYWPRNRLPVFLYNAPNEFQQTNIITSILPEGVGGFTEAFKNRMVFPFNGAYEDFRHVLHHELTHAFVYDMLYGGAIGSMFSRRYLFQLPLWFAEGFAEYSSRKGWDVNGDMIMRDATINDYILPIDFIGGYLAYKQGHLMMLYIAEKYGDEKISELLAKGRSMLSMKKSIKRTLGLTSEDFDEDFAKYCRRLYWQEMTRRKESEELAKRLTDHEKDGSFFNEKPVFAPTGDKLAIFSDRAGYTEIVVISTVDGEVLQKLTKASRSADVESLHSFLSGMSFSPDGKHLVFVSKTHGEDVLRILDIDRNKITDKFDLGFSSILNPSWGGVDANTIIFSGLNGSKSDLYSFNVETEELTQLTNDFYNENEAVFSPDGKYIAFASDRPTDLSGKGAGILDFEYGSYNIFRYNLATSEIVAITKGKDQKRSPTWSPDSKKIAFVADYNGINNLYIKDLISGDLFPVTDVLSNVASPSWSPMGDKIAFSSFNNRGYDIFLLTKIKPVADSPEGIEKTAFYKGELHTPLQFVTDELEPDASQEPIDDSTTLDTDLADPDNEEYGDYVFRSGSDAFSPLPVDSSDMKFDSDSAQAERDSLYGMNDNGLYAVKKYKTKFTPDLVAGGVSYDTFFGLRGQSVMVFSDYLGDHQIYLITDLVNTIDQANFQIYYFNNANRIDWGLGVYHTKYYYVDAIDRLFSDRYYGAAITGAYPFSIFSRLQLDISHLYIDRKYYDEPIENSYNKNTTLALSLIGDNVLWGITGPVDGKRYKLKYERTLDFYHRSVSYWAASIDFRKYISLGKRFSTAFRFAAGMSGGANPKRYFLGGATNWIKNMNVSQEIYNVDNLYFAEVMTPLRGYDYYEIGGRKFFMMNLELRYPFIDYLVTKFPLPIFLSRITGAIFWDMGAAWDVNEHFKGGVGSGPDGNRLNHIKAAFGYGARVNLGFLLLKFDTAWRTNWDKTSGPRYYFSLGAEY